MASEGQAERDELQALVKAAMRDSHMTATDLARAAGITDATMMKMTKALPTKNKTSKRMHDYLSGQAQTEEPERYPFVIESVQQMVGITMDKMDPTEQRAAALRIVAALLGEG